MPPSDEQFESVRDALSAFVAAQLPAEAAPDFEHKSLAEFVERHRAAL